MSQKIALGRDVSGKIRKSWKNTLLLCHSINMLSQTKTEHRREGTSADYGYILGGRFHGVHHAYDGYPQKTGAALAAEAAEISSSPEASEEWSRIAAQVSAQTYVAESDVNEIARAQPGSAVPPIPDHPDGAHAGTTTNLLFLVPRRPMMDVSKYLTGLNVDAGPITQSMGNRVIGEPSWRELAAMPTVTKTTRPFNGTPSAWVVTADLDAKQFVIWDGRDGIEGDPPFGKPYAATDLMDAGSLQRLHVTLSEAINQSEPPALPAEFRIVPRAAGKSIQDGGFARPHGWPPLPGDPNAPMSGKRQLQNATTEREALTGDGSVRPRKPSGRSDGGQFTHKPRPAQTDRN